MKKENNCPHKRNPRYCPTCKGISFEVKKDGLVTKGLETTDEALEVVNNIRKKFGNLPSASTLVMPKKLYKHIKKTATSAFVEPPRESGVPDCRFYHPVGVVCPHCNNIPIAENTLEGIEKVVEGIVSYRHGSMDDKQFKANVKHLINLCLSDKEEEVRKAMDVAEMLWSTLANVGNGNWAGQSPEWLKAAAIWRDKYLALVASHLSTKE